MWHRQEYSRGKFLGSLLQAYIFLSSNNVTLPGNSQIYENG